MAELAVRAATGLRDADALQVTDTPGGATVVARDGRRWAVDVEATPGAPRPLSCGTTPPVLGPGATAVRLLP